MKKKILILLLLIFIPFIKVKALSVEYSAHSQNKGWLPSVKDGETAGTTGLALRMEAIKILVKDSELSGSIEYQVHSQNKGWLPSVKDGEIGGTTGLTLRMEAVKINLTGDLKNKYSVYYRAHVQNKGWLPWVKDGEMAGTTGLALRMEAIEIKLVSKEDYDVSLNYSVHNVDGWLPYVQDGETGGTTGQAKRIDLLKIRLNNFSSLKGNINYQIYTALNNWQDIKINDGVAGINNKGIEAVKISLTDDLEKNFNIYYRVHVQDIGWMSWTLNGKSAGTVGYFKSVEAIEIKLLEKGNNDITVSDSSFMESENNILYSSHISDIGWTNYVKNGDISGTIGKSKKLESFKIKIQSKLSGSVKYKSYIGKRGWSAETGDDVMTGTSGLARNLEAVQIRLTGNISNYYDIYYSVHVSSIGWMSWAKNGESAGCTNTDQQIEAMKIRLVKKGETFNESTDRPYVSGTWRNNNTNYYDAFGRMAKGFKFIDGVKCYFNPDGVLYGKNVQKIIDVSSWQETIDWDKIKKDEDVDAAIIRVGWGTSYNDDCGLDSYFDRNIKEVQRVGIPYGVYIYAYAETIQAAQKEADFVVSKMNQYNMPKGTYVWYDAEIKSIPRNTYNTVIPAFINRIKANGYYNVGVYSGVSQLDTTNGNTNTPTIRSYPIWVSQYYKNLQYTGTYKGWQFASDERVNGISGNVDVSMFKK